MRHVLSGPHGSECAKALGKILRRVRMDILRLISCLVDTWSAVTGNTVSSNVPETVLQLGHDVTAQSKDAKSTAFPLLISLDYIEATALGCAILQDMGQIVNALCPDVCLSLTSDSSWVNQCYQSLISNISNGTRTVI